MTCNTTDKNSATLEKEGGNQYAKMTYKTPDGNMKWYVDNAIEGDTRVSIRMKASDFTASGAIGNYFKVVGTGGKLITHQFALRSYMTDANPYMQIRTLTEGSGCSTNPIGGTKLTTAEHGVTYTATGIDWLTLSIDIHCATKTYDVYVNNVLIKANCPFAFDTESGTISYLDYDARSAANNGYIDDVTISVLDSVDVSKMPASINTVAGMGAEGEVSSKIELSTVGGLKFYPTATYTVDTSKVGNKTAVATIEGFTDPVSVNVKVCNYNVVAGDNKAVLTNISGAAGATALVAYYTGDVFIKADDLVAVNAAKGATQDIPYSAPAGATTVKVFIINNVASVQPIDLVTEIPLA